jgi:hypothetical protein
LFIPKIRCRTALTDVYRKGFDDETQHDGRTM